MKHRRYLRYVIKHKWFAFIECCKLGLVWQGIIHDWSKFLPDEWFPYANYFYGEEMNSNSTKENFYCALLKHINRNPHHWGYWYFVFPDGTEICSEMPLKYAKEMLCDWYSVSRVKTGTRSPAAWYEKNKDRMKFHPSTREWIEQQLEITI